METTLDILDELALEIIEAEKGPEKEELERTYAYLHNLVYEVEEGFKEVIFDHESEDYMITSCGEAECIEA